MVLLNKNNATPLVLLSAFSVFPPHDVLLPLPSVARVIEDIPFQSKGGFGEKCNFAMAAIHFLPNYQPPLAFFLFANFPSPGLVKAVKALEDIRHATQFKLLPRLAECLLMVKIKSVHVNRSCRHVNHGLVVRRLIMKVVPSGIWMKILRGGADGGVWGKVAMHNL